MKTNLNLQQLQTKLDLVSLLVLSPNGVPLLVFSLVTACIISLMALLLVSHGQSLGELVLEQLLQY